MHHLPFVTIVIPVKPGLNPDAIRAVKNLDYPKDRLELFLVYGKNPSYQRNRVIEQAKGEIIYFLDNDSMPMPQTLKLLIKHLEDENVVIAGGPSLAPEKCPFFPFLFGKTLESFFCTGASSSRYKKTGSVRFTTEKEIILCNMVMKKNVFLKFGGLNEKLYPNEENELMEKVKHSGYKIVYNPEACIERMPRKSLKAFIKQIFNYGKGRGEQTAFYPKSFNPFNFVPLFFLVFLILAIYFRNILLMPLILYFSILFFDAVLKVVKERDLRLIFLPLSSFLLHVVYGLGTIYGLLKAPFKKSKTCEISIVKVDLENLQQS